MSDTMIYGREETKQRLRRNVITPGEDAGAASPAPAGALGVPEGGKDELREKKRRKWKRRLGLFAVVLLLLLLGVLAVRYYRRSHFYSSYTTAWEKEIPSTEGGYAGYEKFGSNVLKYTRDGASYIDGHGKIVWSTSYEMKNPVVSVNGDYAAIGDRQGTGIYIFNLSGSLGQATADLPIVNVSVSAYGVVAAQEEDSTASYILFYNKDGTALDVKIKLVMSQSGYILDSSLSPDGTQLMLSDVYVSEGTLGNRISFYNFSDYGMSYPDRLVAGFEEFGTSLAPRVKFLSDRRAVAFAAGKVAFYSLENVTSPEMLQMVSLDEEMKAVAYSENAVAVVTDDSSGEAPFRLHIYNTDGKETANTGVDYSWQDISIDDDFVIFRNDDSCRIYGTDGKERFDGRFDFPASKIVKKNYHTLLVSGGGTIREIRLK
jgi:hypothetical protein